MLLIRVTLIVFLIIAMIACGAAYSVWPPAVQAREPEVLWFYDPLP